MHISILSFANGGAVQLADNLEISFVAENLSGKKLIHFRGGLHLHLRLGTHVAHAALSYHVHDDAIPPARSLPITAPYWLSSIDKDKGKMYIPKLHKPSHHNIDMYRILQMQQKLSRHDNAIRQV